MSAGQTEAKTQTTRERSRLTQWRKRALSSTTGFRRNESGVVAIIFGIALLPAIVLAGGATDVMRGTSLKAQAQGAADAAALAAARNLTRTDAEVEAIIRRTL
ncbi:MAG: pilus assembly protein TadG-related protein, partial [Pseudomonadota bacterium]